MQLVSLTVIRWIVIYPVVSAIERFNNWGLMANIGQVGGRLLFDDLDLPPFQNNISVAVPGVDTSQRSQCIKIEIDTQRAASSKISVP